MRYLFLCLFSLLLAAACSDDDQLSPVDQLPPATQTGENIVACLIDAEPWVNDPNRTGEVNISATYYQTQNVVQMIAFSGEYGTNSGSVLSLIISPPLVGTTVLDSMSIRRTLMPQTQDEVEYFLRSNTGTIEVTHLDINARIISGIFNGALISTTGLDTINVTDGRFDVTFY